MKTLLVAAAIATSQPIYPTTVTPSPEPTVILSGIRHIKCNEGAGSGFVVGENILATALHVARLTNCKDKETGEPLVTYHRDEKNDFALMTGKYPGYLKMRYSCEKFEKGQEYDAYGVSSHWIGFPIFRQYKLIATGDYTDSGFLVTGIKEVKISMPGMQHLKGFIVPGLSGGPVTRSKTGYIVGINNVGGYLPSIIPLRVNNSYSYELRNTVLCKE